MTHEEMMNKAWGFIEEIGFTENKKEYQKNNELYLVEDIYSVRDAYYDDLEKGILIEGEDVCGFLNRHKIDWK